MESEREDIWISKWVPAGGNITYSGSMTLEMCLKLGSILKVKYEACAEKWPLK